MQATAFASSPALARTAAVKSARSGRVAAAPRAAAARQPLAAAAAAAGVSLPALLAAHPALALVDDRLAGEGTGRIFGINDPSLFFVLAGMFGLIWSLYFVSQRDLDANSTGGDDSGLSL